ncbi:DUF1836 domain-containing protein [Faecalibacillus faecis]|uniref:DUF1836 domain-containing protein n=1 Tax=Faecalibacillus faecis TaxID=1982628 RepID=UPI000664A33C|nr:DUF1836 domain-containing protein [Faecalibacillus faecis]KMV78803.1 hypothetical protein HMPREF0979_00284 [Coprobacillus sp. 8_1_38FAA]RGT62195.1 DUF1836 domain-containing protein [Coprobacillus sp. AF18-40]RGT86340.1 DUF1836 domain-containing protein [Coprobacillus sp. AF18-15LB]RHB08080.1 DUF1836 domain-containing protein [Coprobacillus sp. AM42-12AC]RHH12642.1 DUF1836 domain-containing protein [Coprobacillus sp. AM18-4LB-d2]RHP27659.1 DUF1836 domain-containing protein [Coprobacillus sp
MNKELLENIIEKESQKSSLVSKDIPDLDLYMDQIMTLFETHLANNKKNEEDKLLTKTMINNYSKAKVITPVKGKKYTKEQILQMLIIYQLKNNLSIQEIKELLTPIYESDTDLSLLYDHFIDIKQVMNQQLQKLIQQILEDFNLQIENQEDFFLLVASLSSLSHSLTNIAEALINEKKS